MHFRLLLLFTLTLAGMFAQPGIYGPVSIHLKAGDFAPEIVFSKLLNSAGASDWNSDNLSGKVTVAAFFPDTSHNLDSVTRWNALVDTFAGKPIQFAWITGEKESSLLPWLQEHPVKGWVFHDPDGATGRIYGMEISTTVIIGPDRRILGFDQAIIPEQRTLTAALEGRITTVQPQITPAALQAFDESHMVLLSAEPQTMHRSDDDKPDFPPSYTVHISPAKSTNGGNYAGDTFHSLQNVTLRTLLFQLYEINPIRVRLPLSLDDDKRYDIALVLPERESKENINNRILQGIQDYFGVIASREELLSDVYVVTAADGKPPVPLASRDDDSFGGGSSFSSIEFEHPQAAASPDEFPKPVPIGNIRGISLEGTLDDFCHSMELGLDRPVVNETNMKGRYAIDVKAGKDSQNDFLARLRDEFNLNITPAQRPVQVVVLKLR
jgi:uncharacterized protein (TIGR03435 family)